MQLCMYMCLGICERVCRCACVYMGVCVEVCGAEVWGELVLPQHLSASMFFSGFCGMMKLPHLPLVSLLMDLKCFLHLWMSS